MARKKQTPEYAGSITEHVRHEFSADELAEMSSDIVSGLGEISRLEEEIKAIKADFKARIDRAKADVSELVRKVRQGFATVEVGCELRRDLDRGMVLTVRQDNGQVIRERRMTEDERQIKLDEADHSSTEGAEVVHSDPAE